MERKILWYGLWNMGPRSNGQFIVKGYFEYPHYSVLAGQIGKKFIESFDAETPEKAMEYAVSKYGEMNWDSEWTAPQVSLSHLPGEDDFVPGGAYPDDWS